jgi:uncharacterized membrane protein YfcA
VQPQDLLLTGLCALAITCVLSTLYLWRIYRRQNVPRSQVFRMLIWACLVISSVGIYFTYAIIRRFLGEPPLPALIATAFILALFTPPPFFALQVWRLRRRYNGTRPPPFTEND